MFLSVALIIGALLNPGICVALSTPNAAPSTATDVDRAKFLAWFDAERINDGDALELTHIVHVDPLPTDLGGGAHSPERLVRYASLSFPYQLPTKNRAAKAIKLGRLKLNDMEKVEGCRVVQKGDKLTLQIEAPAKLSDDDVVKRMNFVGHLCNSGLSVCYEDDHLAAVFKPAGVHTKKNTVHRYLAFEDALPAILTPSSSDDALPLPLAVHRLDVRVPGLVLVAKSRKALMNLGNQFESKTVKKRYEALVVGDPYEAVKLNSDFVLRDDNTILIDSPIEVEGRGILASRTTMSVLKSMPHTHWGTLSHVQLRPETGRTHQLRIHTARMGCPIVGDDLYWDSGVEARAKMAKSADEGDAVEECDLGIIQDLPPVRRGDGLYLQSRGATFTHPVSGEVMNIEVPLIDRFDRLLQKAKLAREYEDSLNQVM